jgi:hypothetical protein
VLAKNGRQVSSLETLVAFGSAANHLVPTDRNLEIDVFTAGVGGTGHEFVVDARPSCPCVSAMAAMKAGE